MKKPAGSEDRINDLIANLQGIPDRQFHWIELITQALKTKHRITISKTDILDREGAEDFADALKVHHVFSSQPFTKDRFEYILNDILLRRKRKSELAKKGNRGHDITIDGVKFSLKTQADKAITENEIWISKFMEMGKGEWTDKPEQLAGLRDLFLRHMKQYDRILTLRCIKKQNPWKYELVEIPKSLLLKAKDGTFKMKLDSIQTPKPGYCYVKDPKTNETMFSLYFDGGRESKLQVIDLQKKYCAVHTVWEFPIEDELPLNEN